MDLLKTILLTMALLYSCANAQKSEYSAGANEIPMTPVDNIQLFPQQVEIPDKFKNIPGMQNVTVNLPEGWKASLFFADNTLLQKPRFMAWSPDSVLHIADLNSGRILALPDANNDGVADDGFTVASNIFANNLEFYNGALYAAQQTDVVKLTDENGDGTYEKKSTIITGIPGGGGHYTRTIAFDRANQKLYLSIGSSCNVCRENDRGIIEQYNDDGTGKRTYATGVRNAVGLAIHPVTGTLWANNNGSDLQGNDVPPEWIDIIRENGFYGFPYAYHHQNYFNFGVPAYSALLPITAADSANVRSMKLPGALVQAHSAPMQMEFSNNSFPEGFKNGAFVVLRGAWDTSEPNGSKPGYNVVYLRFNSSTDTIASGVTDIITGFQTTGGIWARPVGLALDHEGNIYLGSDDITKFVLKITPKQGQTGINEINLFKNERFALAPNPAQEILTLKFTESVFKNASVAIFDVLGKELRRIALSGSESEKVVSTADLQQGVYFCKYLNGTVAATKQFRVIR